MVLDWQSESGLGTCVISGMLCNFSAARNDIKVSTHAFYTMFEPYETS